MPKMNILLCGGGTGGHYYPLMAIKQDLHSKSDFCFSFIGAKKGIESSKIHSCLLYTSPSPRDCQ